MCAECSPERTARIDRGYAQAERLGDLQNFVKGWLNPATLAGATLVAGSVAVGWVENLPL